MFSKKIILPIAIVSMALLAGCGDDSSSSAPANDPVSSSSEGAVPAGEVSSSSVAAPAGEVSSSSVAAPAGDASSSSVAAPAGDASSSSVAAPAGDASSSSEAAPAGDASSSSEAAAAPAGGDMVSCDVPGVMGECLEYAAGSAEAQQLTESCVSILQGTLGTGCAK